MRYVIDGYNLLFQISFSSLTQSRTEILSVLKEHAKDFKGQLIIVFDGQNHAPDIVRTHTGKLEVIYTAKNQTADQFIEDELVCFCPSDLTIVTDDEKLAKNIRRKKVRTISIEEFLTFLDKKRKSKNPEKEKPSSEGTLEMKRLLKIFESKSS